MIKLIAYTSFPFGRASSNYIRNLAVGLSEYYDIEVLIPLGYATVDGDNTNEETGIFNKVKWRYFCVINHSSSTGRKLFEHVAAIYKLLLYLFKIESVSAKPIIIKYNSAFVINTLLIIACKLKGFRFVTIIPEYYDKRLSKGISRIKWYDFYTGFILLTRFNNGIIVLSSFMESYVRQQGFCGPVIIVPNLVNVSEFNVDTSPHSTHKLTIGYAGTPVQKDGINDLLKCFSIVKKKHPASHLLIIGDTAKKSVIPSLKKLTAEFGIIDEVTFTGLVSFNKVPPLLKACDILVLCRPDGISAKAGFPTKLGEYMACKKPIVLTRVGDLKKYFENSEVVVTCEAGDIECMASKILLLLQDNELRQSLGQRAYDWMLEHLEYRRVAKKVMAFLNNVGTKQDQ